MNESRHSDDALDALLRRGAPQALPDDGFVARTMAAVDAAARQQPVRRRPAPAAPMAIARALAAEQRRHEAQARLWRWGAVGVAAGVVLMTAAMLLSPDGSVTITLPTPAQCFPLCTLLAIGAIWFAVREWRAA